ncbi:cytochrome c oxidase biogenesis protein [Colletotrichum truncatum]|uniref:Cytochrome c oxidase biogenesis protein n=1 Tax=Colletotrichum truncatum TaxID=5467 RepID=A0ACC3YTP9_COLTU
MAAPNPTGGAGEGLPMPSRNPLPLSASQEAQIRDIYYARVRSACAPEIKGAYSPVSRSIIQVTERLLPSAEMEPGTSLSTWRINCSPILLELPADTLFCRTAFADCALNRTFTVSFVCREQLRVMNGCMKSHATAAEQDAAREEWFAKRLERQKERERKAVKKAQQEDFIREWWGLPEKDAETRRKEEEKMRQAERVGGYAARDRKRWEEEKAAAAAAEKR